MTVGKGKTTALAMLKARQIPETIRRRVRRKTIHANTKVAGIQTIRAHVEEDKDVGSARVGGNVIELFVQNPFGERFVRRETSVVLAPRGPQPVIHAHGSHAGLLYAADVDKGPVPRAFPDRRGFPRIRP